MAKKGKKKINWLLVGGIALLVIVGYWYMNKEEVVFNYDGPHKYTSNQFQPKDACLDRWNVYRDQKGLDNIDLNCETTAEGDLKVGGTLHCLCIKE